MPGTKRFTKVVEDFNCGKCGLKVAGRGFTNHCPRCLWSRHVDINPGDRAAACGGLMRPVSVVAEKSGYAIRHRCVACGYEKKNRASEEDDFEELLKVAKQNATAAGL
jgi:rubredoxin